MFSFFKRTIKQELDLSSLQCDMHSHLIPGIDDGAADVEASMHMIKGLHDLGYSRFITTPHIYWDLYKNTPEIINAGKELLIEKIKEENIPVKLHAAAEYFLDDHVERLLKDNQPFQTIQEKMVLIEFSFVTTPINWQGIVFDLQMQGYQPVLAHPERYTYFAGNRKVFDEIKTSGCLLQVNILSLTGYYGKIEKELAEYLVTKNLITFLGTDMHHLRHLDALRGSGTVIMPVLKKLLDGGYLKNGELMT